MNSSKKMLVIEDDPSIVRLLEMIFRTNNNFEVYSTYFGGEAPNLIKKIDPTIIILDIELPDYNGIELINEIRQHTQAPIIMLSGKNSDLEKISSFNFGADDYVVKPFSVAELSARVSAVLRRSESVYKPSQTLPTMPTTENEKHPVINLLPDEHRVFIRNQEISLTKKEFQLLQLLNKMKGKVLTREIILDHIWGISNLDIETRAVDACVSRLRKKVSAVLGQDVIEAIPGSGYRLSI